MLTSDIGDNEMSDECAFAGLEPLQLKRCGLKVK